MCQGFSRLKSPIRAARYRNDDINNDIDLSSFVSSFRWDGVVFRTCQEGGPTTFLSDPNG